jgi:5-formyltetrahydrofolate cyclo-ligase
LTKQQLRKQYFAKRQQLTMPEYEALNQQLLQQFQQLDFSNIHCIHLFLPIRERKEPDTYLMIDWLKATHPHIKIVYPKTDFKTLSMQSFAADDALKVKTNGYGIPEPIAGNMVDVKEIDMVLIPLLAFDKQGYRVGYGKGFYDRFLTQCKPGTQFTGLSFFEPVDMIEDIDEYDVRMHTCIMPTEKWQWQD